jgi:hypothetical protein
MNLSQRDGYIPKEDCNGCGAGWTAKLVPNTIYGMDIKPICCIHDDRYETVEKSIEHKNMSDREFLNNIVRKINADTRWWRNNRMFKFLMRRRAYKYYKAVKYFGGEAYWDGKKI